MGGSDCVVKVGRPKNLIGGHLHTQGVKPMKGPYSLKLVRTSHWARARCVARCRELPLKDQSWVKASRSLENDTFCLDDLSEREYSTRTGKGQTPVVEVEPPCPTRMD